ncbi:hypothetical protein T265_01398 [Opisthorchis viverrini]|uniref:Uncharacterized protein n=1 Tax=Opisthorchis viverrini TaxID=6198 RepID=A0A075A9T6_OPIVI|nr:hypothetical protein T265_01398 [Opisthorchis viverrini]KER32520.1 hypothetical protein T265_01398 [Opisthorchis viverrini]
MHFQWFCYSGISTVLWKHFPLFMEEVAIGKPGVEAHANLVYFLEKALFIRLTRIPKKSAASLALPLRARRVDIVLEFSSTICSIWIPIVRNSLDICIPI